MPFPRLHLIEIHEQRWCPAFLRRGLTDGLFTVWKTMFWRNTLPHLRDLLAHSDSSGMIDLCSGSGGPMPLIAAEISREFPDLSVVLTDLFPNRRWSSPDDRVDIGYHPEPVDAMNVPDQLVGVRTMFESFHHFRPGEATRILSDAVKAGQPIAVFEFQRREFLDTILSPIALVVPVASICSFRHTPFRLSKLLFTLIPVIPFLLLFDGAVSMLRTHSPGELADMAAAAGTDGYRWEVRQTRTRGMGRMTCLIGWPCEEGGVEVNLRWQG
jgi:hypothetical protein